MDKLLRNKRTILCFLLPGIIVYTISVIVPIIWSAYYSLVEWSGYGDITYVGFENFRKLMVDTEFWDSVIHTLIYAAGQIVLQVGGGLLLAVLLTNIVVFRKPLQVMYYLPVIVSTVALCQMFKKMGSYRVADKCKKLFGYGYGSSRIQKYASLYVDLLFGIFNCTKIFG